MFFVYCSILSNYSKHVVKLQTFSTNVPLHCIYINTYIELSDLKLCCALFCTVWKLALQEKSCSQASQHLQFFFIKKISLQLMIGILHQPQCEELRGSKFIHNKVPSFQVSQEIDTDYYFLNYYCFSVVKNSCNFNYFYNVLNCFP